MQKKSDTYSVKRTTPVHFVLTEVNMFRIMQLG
jgi:hypothetical protein